MEVLNEQRKKEDGHLEEIEQAKIFDDNNAPQSDQYFSPSSFGQPEDSNNFEAIDTSQFYKRNTEPVEVIYQEEESSEKKPQEYYTYDTETITAGFH